MAPAARVALVALAAVVWLMLPAAASAATIGGFSVRPATFNPRVPATRAYFEPVIRAGAVYSGHVIVTNAGAAPVELRVDPVDGVTAVTSGAVYTNRQVPLRAAGRWVKPATPEVTVPAAGHTSVGFSVDVPAGAVPGNHLAGLAFQDAHPLHSGGRFSITEVIRAVVGISIVVPGPAAPQIQLRHISLRALPGTQVPAALITLVDAGRKLCKPTLVVSLSKSGQRDQTVRRRLDTLLPGNVIPFPFEWPKPLGAGAYRASVSATGCGAEQHLGAVVGLGKKLTGTTVDPQSLSAPRPASGGGIPLPLVLLIGLGGIALGSGAALRYGRRPPVA